MAVRLGLVVAIVATLLGAGRAAAQDPSLGSFTQLTGTSGCIVQTGFGSELGGCGRARGLARATAVTVSPDQRHVYVVAAGSPLEGSSAVVAFTRSAADGSLDFAGCVSDTGGDGRVGSDGRCDDGDALLGANDVAITADGRFVYVSSGGSGGVSWFERDADTGRLTQRGCVKDFVRGDRCSGGFGLVAASSVDVSPDGRSVYVTGRASGALVVFDRSAETGALTQRQCISDSGSDGACDDGTGLAGASQVTVAPDGADVYVTSSLGAVTGYRRDAASGALRPHVCLLADAPDQGSCRTSPALAGAADVAVSPDGRSVFVASEDDDALAILARDPSTGALEADDCFRNASVDFDPEPTEPPPPPDADDARGRASGAGGCRLASALLGASAVVVSGDGRAVFVTSPDDYLAAFARNPATGRLDQFACAEDEESYGTCTATRGIAGGRGMAVSRDAENLYIANPQEDAVAVFSATVAIVRSRASLRSDRSIRLRLGCPPTRRGGCRGHVRAKLASRPRLSGVAGRYRIRAGDSELVRVTVARDARRRVRARGRAVLTVVAQERRRDVRATARRVTIRRAG